MSWITKKTKKTPPAEWTLLVYVAGDNDLHSRAEEDVKELEAGSSPLVNIGVHLDRLGKKTQVLKIANRKRKVVRTTKNENSGDPRVLTKFLNWGRKEFGTTSKYIVCLSNHGKGWLDFTKEELGKAVVSNHGDAKVLAALKYSFFTSTITKAVRRYVENLGFVGYSSIALDATSRDFLEGLEMRDGIGDALAKSEKFEVIGCDACFMSMLEVVYDLRQLGEIFIGSQEVEESTGWPYTDMLAKLNAGATVEEAVVGLVGGFRTASVTSSDAALSAIRLAAIDAVVAAVDALGGRLLALLTSHLREIAIARANTKFFKLYDYVDLHHFAENVKVQFTSDASVAAAAQAVMDAAEAAVVDTSNNRRATGANGLSVYMPDAPVNCEYGELLLVKAAPRWRAFVESYGVLRKTL